MLAGEFDGKSILELRHKHEKVFWEERNQWIHYIREENKELGEGTIRYLEKRTKRLNLAVRLGGTFHKDAAFWSLPFEEQVGEIIASVQRLKPFVDFFVR